MFNINFTMAQMIIVILIPLTMSRYIRNRAGNPIPDSKKSLRGPPTLWGELEEF
jgi:hypothetical protein